MTSSPGHHDGPMTVRAVSLAGAIPVIGTTAGAGQASRGVRARPATGRPPEAAIKILMAGVDPQWFERGACRRADPALFETVRATGAAVNKAKRICRGCPVRDPCLRAGLANADRHAILGGTTVPERRPLHYAAARKSLALAERIGVKPAARQLKVGPHVLYHAWELWGLGRPTPQAQPAAS